jgi:RNA polymerase sigma-70 factor (ECF subfamily)
LREEAVDDIERVVDVRFDAAGRWLRPPQPADAGLTRGEIMRHLEECLEQVPLRARSAFVLREIEQLDTAEICNILEVSANNFGVLLYRARNRLRECLETKGIRGSADAAV